MIYSCRVYLKQWIVKGFNYLNGIGAIKKYRWLDQLQYEIQIEKGLRIQKHVSDIFRYRHMKLSKADEWDMGNYCRDLPSLWTWSKIINIVTWSTPDIYPAGDDKSCSKVEPLLYGQNITFISITDHLVYSTVVWDILLFISISPRTATSFGRSCPCRGVKKGHKGPLNNCRHYLKWIEVYAVSMQHCGT